MPTGKDGARVNMNAIHMNMVVMLLLIAIAERLMRNGGAVSVRLSTSAKNVLSKSA